LGLIDDLRNRGGWHLSIRRGQIIDFRRHVRRNLRRGTDRVLSDVDLAQIAS
jgi:hypothetical protein